MKNNHDELEKSIAAWLGDEAGYEEKVDYLTDLDDYLDSGPGQNIVEQVQRRLEKAMESTKESAVFYDVLEDTPVGQVMVALQTDGIVAVEIGMSEDEFVAYVGEQFGEPVVASKHALEGVIIQLEEYFLGRRRSFDLPVSLGQLTQFQRDVLEVTIEIESGSVSTYGEIARRLGKNKAARAVGQALARNPIPIIIPCHRVLGSDGALHGYSGGRGIETKRHLLQLEGAFSS